VHPDEDVLLRRHLPEQADVLEGPADAELGDRVRRLAGQVVAVEEDLARGRPVDPREHVEERRLARAVRPDQADDALPRDREVHVVHRDEAAELLSHGRRDQDVALGLRLLDALGLGAHDRAS